MFSRAPKIENIILATAVIVVAVFVLDCFGWYYYVARLVSELEWTAALVVFTLYYKHRPKKNYVTATLFALFTIQMWCLLDAIWVTTVYIQNGEAILPDPGCHLHHEFPVLLADAIIYKETHAIHIAGYWLITGIALEVAAFAFIIWATGILQELNSKLNHK